MPENAANQAAAEERLIGERYRLTDPLGRGAMGTVWAGYDEVLHRPVAVKELRVPPGIPSGEMAAMRERMMREARTLGGLSHPNVITLYDVVDVAGDPYVVLELLPSRNLGEVIDEQGRLSVAQAASVGIAVAAALEASHKANITHRDVKPGNVLVAHDGRIKLTDFGIARRRDDLTMTATGLVLGSPAYIAPEVAAGEEVTPAADLWGLGATLFAALESRPPYDVDGDPVKTVTAVVHDDVPVPTRAGPLTEIITALMVKDPAGRLSLPEVRRRLRPMLADPDDPLFPGSPEAFSRPPSYESDPTSTGGSGLIGGAAGEDLGSSWTQTGRAATSSGPGSGGQPPAWGTGYGTGQHGYPQPPPGPAPAPLSADPGPLPGGTGWGAPPAPPTPRPVAPTPAPQQYGAYPPAAYQPPPSGGYPPAPAGGYPTGAPPRPAGPSLASPTDRVAPAKRPLGAAAMLAGALAVIVGLLGGWVGTRALVSQSPLSTGLVSPGAVSPATSLKTHVDAATVYGTGALGFSVGVPRDWEEYRLAGDNDGTTVMFVSPDGSRELRFDKLRGSRDRPANPNDFVNSLTAARLGVAGVSVQERVGNQLRYRTDRRSAEGTSSRVHYAQLTPAGADVWVLQLAVPADAAGDTNKQLFTSVVQGFKP
jgi:serine/threonine protein kinase